MVTDSFVFVSRAQLVRLYNSDGSALPHCSQLNGKESGLQIYTTPVVILILEQKWLAM